MTTTPSFTRSSSRRSFVSLGARLAAAGTLTGVAAGISRSGAGAAAREDRDKRSAGRSNPGDATALAILLQVERRQAAFYAEFIRRFGADEMTSGDRIRPGHVHIHQVLRQERRHVAALERALISAGGNPETVAPSVPAFASEAEFYRLAAEIEAEAVAAYVGALPTVVEREDLALGLSLLAEEARQAAIFSVEAGNSPFIDGAQPGLAREDLIAFIPVASVGRSPLLTVED